MIAQNIFLLICGHALCDFALQTEWVATNKNRHVRKKLTSAQEKTYEVIWPWLLGAHALHHGLAVFVVTQKLSLGILEFLLHGFIDFGKCEQWFGFHVDQVLHLGCKLLWVWLIYAQIL